MMGVVDRSSGGMLGEEQSSVGAKTRVEYKMTHVWGFLHRVVEALVVQTKHKSCRVRRGVVALRC